MTPSRWLYTVATWTFHHPAQNNISHWKIILISHFYPNYLKYPAIFSPPILFFLIFYAALSMFPTHMQLLMANLSRIYLQINL